MIPSRSMLYPGHNSKGRRFLEGLNLILPIHSSSIESM
jgi:hypothetical protein